MWRRIALSAVAALFGIAMIVTGDAVYELGERRLANATQEVCNVTAVRKSPCEYGCGGVTPASRSRNCTGHFYSYTAVSEGKCGAAQLLFTERRDPTYRASIGMFGVDVRRRFVNVCRCGPSRAAGDCYVGLPVFDANRRYPCTVDSACTSFYFQDPDNDLATGALNIALGSVFIVFAVMPARCARLTGVCITKTVAYVVPVLQRALACCVTGGMRWLVAVQAFTAAPAQGFAREDGASV
eukprot:TRINITY_DN39795_c0_g1_i1.p1 TRINITY_DN39795_c0_g1~~TRINITY_DN39795_c0_g1_i1.p1  ORF type:complete len:240 (+),score=43.28 TRINITY_DN39795_c0_g1_i1:70-789(+)